MYPTLSTDASTWTSDGDIETSRWHFFFKRYFIDWINFWLLTPWVIGIWSVFAARCESALDWEGDPSPSKGSPLWHKALFKSFHKMAIFEHYKRVRVSSLIRVNTMTKWGDSKNDWRSDSFNSPTSC